MVVSLEPLSTTTILEEIVAASSDLRHVEMTLSELCVTTIVQIDEPTVNGLSISQAFRRE
jgi:hypothetical protein